MATDQFSPATGAKPVPTPQAHAGSTHAASSHSATTTHSTATAKATPTPTPRPTGFVRTPAAPLPSFSAQHEPESSNIGRYVTIGVIGVLIILLVFQVVSKSRLRRQVQTLEEQNTALSQQASVTPTTAPTATTTPTEIRVVTPTTSDTNVLQLLTYPVLYREKQYQKIAQTIGVTTNAKISGVSLRGIAGQGSAGQVAIYEGSTPAQINTRKDIVKQSFDPAQLSLTTGYLVQFKRDIELKAGVAYVLVIETTNRDTQAQIAYRAAAATAPGGMWVNSRKLSATGDVLEQDFTWQEIPGYDLFFELRGAE